MHFNYNGKYTIAEKQLAEHGRKASFALSKQIKDMYLNVEGTKFLDTYISSILNYVSEVWVMDKGVNIEKITLVILWFIVNWADYHSIQQENRSY